MKHKSLELGDRVILVADRHGVTKANPVWGSLEYPAVVGTIDKVEYGIGVMWDNGTHNGYSRNDLALYDTPGGICISIWKEG